MASSLPEPVSYQPQATNQIQWMNKPQANQVCPPGLEYLSCLDQLLIKQEVDVLEVAIGWEAANKFKILNNQEQQVYYAFEESDVCMRQLCTSDRGFVLHIVDNMNKEVIRVTREFKCCAGCCWCACSNYCAFKVDIEAPVGTHIGTIRQECSALRPLYTIRNPDEEVVFNISGPLCVFDCLGGQDFNITSPNGQDVGTITKEFAGLIKELFTKADNFGVVFPQDLDVKMKACILGAVFLIDFMYFEDNHNDS